jgi:hypothetical protein
MVKGGLGGMGKRKKGTGGEYALMVKKTRELSIHLHIIDT